MNTLADPPVRRSIAPQYMDATPALGELALVLPAASPHGAVVLGEDEIFWHIEPTDAAPQVRPLREHGLALPCIGHTQTIEPAGLATRVAYLQSRRVVILELTTQRGHTAPVTENLEHMSVRGAWLDPGDQRLIVEVRDTGDFYRHGVVRHVLREVHVPPPAARSPLSAPSPRSPATHDSRPASLGPGRDGSPVGDELDPPDREPAATPDRDEPEHEDEIEWDALLEDLDELLQETEDELADLGHDALDPELTAALMELEREFDSGGTPSQTAQIALGAAPREEFAWHAGGGVIIVIRGAEVTAWQSLEQRVEHPLAHALAGFIREGATITELRLHPRRERAVFCVRPPGTRADPPRGEIWCADWHKNAYAARWQLHDGLDGSIELGPFDPDSDWFYYDLHTRDATQRYVQRAQRGHSEPHRLEDATGPMAWSPPGPKSARILVGFDLDSGTIMQWTLDAAVHR